ncbi:MAG: DNA-binding protein [Clostridia bacterium]|nr:DNA-binding protein [Clostridia bacterium]
MQYKRFGDTYAVRIDIGEEIMQELNALCAKEGILFAEVSAIGAVSHAVIGVYDLEAREYCKEELDAFMEITSLNGSVTTMAEKPYVHLHATLAGQDHVLHGGHALSLQVGATCEMFVRVMDGKMDRERNEALGINVWHF